MWNSIGPNKILHKKVKHKLTNFIYPNLLTTLPMLIFAAFIIFFKLEGHTNIIKEHLIFWLVALLTVVVCQGTLAVWYQKTKYSLKWEHLYYKLLVTNAGLIGALWGIAGVVFMPDDGIGQSYITFTLAFIAAGGLVYLTGSYLAGTAYVTGILLPLAGLFYFSLYSQSNNEIYLNVTLGIVSYWVFLLTINYFGSKLYAENFTQRVVIKTLSEDLSHASEQLEKINLIPPADKEKLYLSQNHETVMHEKISRYTDTLTGLDTQEVLEIKFAQSRAYARRHHQGFAVFIIDVTNFNDVKTTLGEEIANLLVKTVALRLQYCKREADILSRFDENKFILIISEVLLGNEIRAVTNRVFKTLDENTVINNNKININVNIGISLYPLDGENLKELIKKSEIALFYLFAEKNEPLQSQIQIYDKKTMTIEDKNKI